MLQAVPTHVLDRLPPDDRLRKMLRKHPGATVAELMAPSLAETDDSVVPARLLSMHAFHTFVSLVATFPGVAHRDIEILTDFRSSVQNSASHGSSELIGYHFEGARADGSMRGGAYFDIARADTYRRMADDLIGLLQMMSRFLEASTAVVRAGAAAV